MSLIKVLHAQEPEVDLTRTYDAIVIGSGAAGGMAAHVLTSQGLKVLLLEAGRKLDIDKELKSMEWPYEHPRRGAMPPDREALTMNEYTIRQPPYGALSKFNKVHSNIQSWNAADYSKNIVVDEKEHPYTGTRYAWVRARLLGGKTNIWGRLALRLWNMGADALATFESEVNLIKAEFGDNFDVVYPKSTILAENPVSVVDKVVDKKGTRKQAEAWLKFLWTDEAQEIAARHQLRPRSPALLAKYAKDFPKVNTFTIDEVFGGWTKAQKEHFDDGAIYDQILGAGKR